MPLRQVFLGIGSQKGPWRDEITFMGDLLRSPTLTAPETEKPRALLEAAGQDAVARLLAAARKGKVERSAWADGLASMLAGGRLRRGSYRACWWPSAFETSASAPSTCSLSASRWFDSVRAAYATEMHAIGQRAAPYAAQYAAELREAAYSAEEMLSAGFAIKGSAWVATRPSLYQPLGHSAQELRDGGYTATHLRQAGFGPRDLRPPLFDAMTLRGAGFSAHELRGVQLALGTLRAAGFTAVELKQANFYADELRDVGCTASELRAAGFANEQMRVGGYTAAEMREAGVSAKKLRSAGWAAADVLAAGWRLEVLASAGYSVKELKSAGCSAAELAAIGCDPRRCVAPGHSA